MKKTMLVLLVLFLNSLSQAGVVTGGWTVDTGYVDFLESTGRTHDLFKSAVIEVVNQKFADLESAGTLTPAEKAMRNQGWSVDRVIQFIKNEPKWSRGIWMPWVDIRTCIDNQWSNILKQFVN